MNLDLLLQRAQSATTVKDLFNLIIDIIDYLQFSERDLEDVLTNLDSDNIAEIDFSRTRVKNTQKLTEDVEATLENIKNRLKHLEDKLSGGGN